MNELAVDKHNFHSTRTKTVIRKNEKRLNENNTSNIKKENS